MIELQNLSKVYRTEDVETTALDNLNLTIHQGEFVSVMGTSGCGKSTLLNIVGMLDRPTSGAYIFRDHDISGLSEKDRAQIRKSNIGFIFQNFNLIDELTVWENVELPLHYLGIAKSARREMVDEVLERIGIAHRSRHYPRQLSGGQQQRVAVCRAVIAKPKLILADEPTGNLDSHFGQEVMELIKGLHETGTTVVMVTHSKEDAKYSERIIELYDGRIRTENQLQPNSF
ncbi:MAG: ATP-binding cassette domain-containing protein [Bacteroidetes bacterium]|nr:ATP-binding cassette domain-containing protein [Bacteroidota bacterium]